MTRPDILNCIHEPFGDAFYWGPERLSERFAKNATARENSGFSNTTYKDVVDQIFQADQEVGISLLRYFFFSFTSFIFLLTQKYYEHLYVNRINDMRQGKRIFIKDITYYLLPPDGKRAEIAPSLRGDSNGLEEGNPTVLPTDLLAKFHFTFLIRHPRRAIPSYYRCTVPPLDKQTGFYHFMVSEVA